MDVVAVQKYVSAKALAREAGISMEELKLHNPALLGPVRFGEGLAEGRSRHS